LIFDHDSEITSKYLTDAISKPSIGIGVPIITSFGKQESPVIKSKSHCGPFTQKDRVRAIGSGLVIEHNIVKKLIKRFGNVFDERFYLYGVDTTFFYRVRRANLNNKIKLIAGFRHSMSRLEQENKVMTSFRVKERSYEIGLTTRFYFSDIPLSILKITIKRCLFLNTLSVKTTLRALITGKHYRDI
jgi:GT2 family glycosyltransferase